MVKESDWVDEVVGELPLLATPAEVSEKLRMARREIYRLVTAGRIKAVQAPGVRAARLKIPRSAVAEYLRGLEPAGAAGSP